MSLSIFHILRILRIIRLHIVIGGALAFSLGALMALAEGGNFNFILFGLAYFVVFLGDLSSHFSNDYFDVEVDRDSEKRKYFAGSKILVNNPALRVFSRNVSILFLLSSVSLAAAIVLFLGGPIELFLIMLCADLLSWFYSAPPIRLVSKGFGEITVAWVTGFVIPGAGYLAVRGQFDPVFFYFSFPFMLYGFILSLCLHAPDAEIDLKSGKKTLGVRIGKHAVISLTLVCASLALLTLFFYNVFQIPTVLNLGVIFLFSTAPFGFVSFGFVRYWRKRELVSFSNSSIVSLFLFNALMIVYLFFASLA
jgi:1,4-dihydroxy-2-naphthoate polyprenyltransferase